MQSLQSVFGIKPIFFQWSGSNTRRHRQQAAAALTTHLRQYCATTQINLVGFSHGGNVAALATQQYEGEIYHLVTIATPVLEHYQPGAFVKTHIHLYNPNDPTQTRGGELFRLPYFGTIGRAARTFIRATNIAIDIPSKSGQGAHGDILWNDATWRILSSELRHVLPSAESPLPM
jgi:pimeloyl-ACP methyl ester carboxylesterase